MSWLKAPLPALASGLLFAGALPPFNQWWLAWLWAFPLLGLMWSQGERRGWRQFFFGLRHGWLTGCVLFLSTLWWLGHVTLPGMIALCLYLAFFPALWAGFAAVLRPRSPGHGLLVTFALALLWTGTEWARGRVPVMGFPWNGAAVPLVEMPGLRSLAGFAGVIGLSALPFFFMCGVAAAWTLRRHRNVRGRAVLMAVSMATPAAITLVTWQKSPPPAAHVQVLLVQPNVSMDVKMNLNLRSLSPDEQKKAYEENRARRYAELEVLTKSGLASAKIRPDLVVWPESALPELFHDPIHQEWFGKLFAAGALRILTGCDALTASAAHEEDWNHHNCAALMGGSWENFILHAKVHLVPFGEYIPLRRQLPFLEDMLGDLIPSDFTAGTSLEPLQLDDMPFEVIPLVCFEDTIPNLARKFVRDAPQLLANITNDNWFHESNESAIHALNARWRCLELQRPMVRAANTGVTCVIDTEGRMTDELPRWKQGVLHASVPLTNGGITFYAANGDIIPVSAGIMGFILSLALLITKRSAP